MLGVKLCRSGINTSSQGLGIDQQATIVTHNPAVFRISLNTPVVFFRSVVESPTCS